MPDTAKKTVALLFTDIESSTRLLQRLGAGYRQVLDDHFRLLQAAIETAGGTVENTMGDGVFAVFATAPQALHAALDAQRCLAAHDWPDGGIIRVRMGMHVGQFAADETKYVSLDVHRTARICAAGHGGQVLISKEAKDHCEPHMFSDTEIRDLGRHVLKDLQNPVQLFQATGLGLLAEFPPPRSLHASPHNLPSEVSDFIGRTQELEDITRLLADTRLLTLVGPGGTGKTRLALRAASQALPRFDGGVFFVPLEAIVDPQLVGGAIGRTLGLNEGDGRPALDLVIEKMASQKFLLALDNFEQVLGAAPAIEQLLERCHQLTVIVTSRAILKIHGEQVFEVPPLQVPTEDVERDPDKLAEYSGVNLFVRRARAVQPAFRLTRDNAAAVAQIVMRLDGLPLAIELAAVRSRLFPPEMLIKRLDRRLNTLSTGYEGTSPHGRTLRDAIAWSYDLLDAPEQAVFRRLGIFVGGFTLEAAESIVAGEPSIDAIEAVGSLLDKSLLRSKVLQGEARLTMLETIREFALEQLDAADEHEQIAGRHVAWVLGLSEELEKHLTGRGEFVAVNRLNAEHANVRAALRTCLDRGDFESGLRICGAIWRFWHSTGQILEGLGWFDTLLASPDVSPSVRAKSLTGQAGLAYWRADYAKAMTCYEAALEIYRNLGDRFMEADTLFSQSTTLTWSGDADAGSPLADEALSLFDALGARDKVGEALMAQGFARWMKNDLADARPLWEASLAVARETGNHAEAATKVLALATIQFRLGKEDAALEQAMAALNELVELNHVTNTIMALDFIASMGARANPRASTRLAAAANRLRAEHGGGMRPEASGLENACSVARGVLDAVTIDRLWSEGEEIALEDAIALAREIAELVTDPSLDLNV